ncbi:hypothetical protein NESM_000347800 [Novymonas esmeraldas]|uniref:Uncharacterized protein n=1 Tax=Novymonas esmeraldas TaxID=1808958 RepID=A0AAW0EJQ8_9TRYP
MADYTVGSASARRTGAGGNTTSKLDDAALLRVLVKSAKSAHSTLGRALDTNLSHQRFGGAEMEPSALTMNRRERERQMRLQREMQTTCGDTHMRAMGTQQERVGGATLGSTAGVASRLPAAAAATAVGGGVGGAGATSQLFIPALPTMAPSMTAAADDGTEALGGTKIGGDDRGYVTLIGAVPTYATTRLIEDNYELISSFRAYRTDALRTEQQTALRDVSAPHPDLLQQLAPLVHHHQQTRQDGEADPKHLLVDQETLPYRLRQRYAMDRASQAATAVEAGDEAAAAEGPEAQLCADGTTPTAAAATTPARGTWAFTCQGRPDITGARQRSPSDSAAARRRLIGHRQPCIGQYHVRYGVVEPRVVGGYVAPQALATHGHGEGEAAAAAHDDPAAHDADGDRVSVAGQTQRDDWLGTTNPRGSRASDADSAARRGGSTHGRNIKGSSMFISESPRQLKGGTAAPDVFYWPYPDLRSSAKRVPCFVQLDHPTTHRRREPLISGVPASVYEVCGDIAANQPRTVTMNRSTGRGSHWYGRAPPDAPGEPLDVDAALRATRPKERVTTLPPREARVSAAAGPDSTRAQLAAVDTSVSVERNPAYPPTFVGHPDQLTHIRDFGKNCSRADREAVAMRHVGSGAGAEVPLSDDAEEARAWTERRSCSAIIHPRAPGHQPLHAPNVTELGDVPSLALTKPRAGCTTDLGKGQVRPTHLLPLRDLTYNAEPGYALIGPRVKGTPSLSRTVARQQARLRGTAEGCGAKVMYNPTNYLIPTAKSVPDFEKQITKEYEFRGHRVQSERYLRLFPSAPGPGHYTVNYTQVE